MELKRISIFLCGLLLLSTYSCKKESITQNPAAPILFSTDTVFFDTVFTATGSTTRSFKIINPNDQKLRLTSISLTGGDQSPFQLNINGVPANEVRNEVINAGDSLYVFVQVMIRPDDRTQPFVLQDSIEVSFNGNKRFVQLQAYGQNAVFYQDKIISADTTWKNALPVVILGSLTVEEHARLTIMPGTRVFVHATAPFMVKGSLRVLGTPDERVIFSGDRTDEAYRDLPAGWPGIYLAVSSYDNLIRGAVIKNAYQGIIVDQLSDNGNPKLTLSQSNIENVYDVGLLALGSSIVADNCLIANCGANIALVMGGDYHFTNCTVATFGSFYINHAQPVLQIADFLEQSGTMYTASLRANFVNSIFWGDNGNVDNEIVILKKGDKSFNVEFSHCLYKAKTPVFNAGFINCLTNVPPAFDSINPSKNIYDFHFRNHPESPAVKQGIPVMFHQDLDGKMRVDPPDIGCYER